MRWLVNADGEVTFVRSYTPYGQVLSSVGSAASSYGFTGEWTDSTGLVYLRARYYAPGQGRFLTQDVWDGNPNQSMSYNPWLYGYANPIMMADPSGKIPSPPPPSPSSCKERGGGRYCILNDGGYLDTAHFRGGKNMARDILSALKQENRLGREGSPLSLEQGFFPGLPPYGLTYRTYLPKEPLEEGILIGVALGIFMDFQIRYEMWQGIDPRCYIPVLGDIAPHCSSFSNEDLVSDYLGFIDYIDSENNFDSIIRVLGGGVSASSPPAGYHPTANKFTSFRLLEMDECKNLKIVQRYLPSSLRTYKPIEAGTYWDVPIEYSIVYSKFDLSQWY